MKAGGRRAIIRCVAFAVIAALAAARADAVPSDLELQAAYCLGSAQVVLEHLDSFSFFLYPPCDPAKLGTEFCRREQQENQQFGQQTKQILTSNIGRLQAYLVSKGMLNPGTDPTGDLLAFQRGRADQTSLVNALPQITSACKSAKDIGTCLRLGNPALADVQERIGRCPDAIKALPF